MALPQYAGEIVYNPRRAYYMGTLTLQQGMAVYFDLDPTACALPAWDAASLAPNPDPGANVISIAAVRQQLPRAVQDVPANGVSNNNGTAGTANINSSFLAGVVAVNPVAVQSGSSNIGPYWCEVIAPNRGEPVLILVNYNSALPGDVVIPDESTPSNTFGVLLPLGGTAGTVTVNTGTSLGFAQNNGGSLQAGSGSPYPDWKSLVRAKYVVMQTGPTTGVQATVSGTLGPALVWAMAL
jgi:hypothetical protein